MTDSFWFTLNVERPNGVTLGAGLDAEVRVCWAGGQVDYEIDVKGYDANVNSVRYRLTEADPLYPAALRTLMDKYRSELSEAERSARQATIYHAKGASRGAAE